MLPACVFIVRNPQGQIKLYSKGADTVIFDRLDPSSEDLMYTTSEHLSVSVQTQAHHAFKRQDRQKENSFGRVS